MFPKGCSALPLAPAGSRADCPYKPETEMRARLFAKLLATFTACATSAFASCGTDPNPCTVPLGTYHIALPETPRAGKPSVIFLHGAGGKGMDARANTGMSNAMLKRGYALIGADGLPRPGKFGTGWYFHPDFPRKRDEVAFFQQIKQDVASRFGLNPDKILLAGFSVGGSMVSYVACQAPDSFFAYAPIAGSFWRPHPTGCAGPVRLFHTHGWSDGTVPLEGRTIGSVGVTQGDVWHAMEIWRATNGCDLLRPDAFNTKGPFWRRRWDKCANGSALEFALHAGGHGIPMGWSDMALDWFESLEKNHD
jgi:polyhydroxybutyrate depolymerase